jgi:hypothetical protein
MHCHSFSGQSSGLLFQKMIGAVTTVRQKGGNLPARTGGHLLFRVPVDDARKALAAAGSSDKQLHIFTAAQGGAEHVQADQPDQAS